MHPSTASLTYIGQTRELTATSTGGSTPAWTSSNTRVATVSSTGIVSAEGNGTATISATTGSGASGSASITVAQRAYDASLSPDSVVLIGPAQNAPISVVVRDEGGATIRNPSLTWVSNDETVARVASSGIVTSVAAGFAGVSAVATDGGAVGVAAHGQVLVFDSVRVTTDNLTNAIVGNAYEAQLQAEGGSGVHEWRLVSGSLPSGLRLDPDGAIRGTATTLERRTFVVEVSDIGQSREKELSLGTCDLSFGECR